MCIELFWVAQVVVFIGEGAAAAAELNLQFLI
jgi:hypothetical protein